MAKSLAEIIASVEAELVELKALQLRLNKEAGLDASKAQTPKEFKEWRELRVGQMIRLCAEFENIVGHKFPAGVYEVDLTEKSHYQGDYSVRLVEPGKDASALGSPVWTDMQHLMNTVGVVEA